MEQGGHREHEEIYVVIRYHTLLQQFALKNIHKCTKIEIANFCVNL
jgi:hypothetical protein